MIKKVILKGDMVIEAPNLLKATHVMFTVAEYEMMKTKLALILEPDCAGLRLRLEKTIMRFFAKFYEKDENEISKYNKNAL